MKSSFVKLMACPRAKSASLLLGLLLSPLMVMGTDPIFINSGNIIGIPPNVDATNFLNQAGAEWDIDTLGSQPYETSHTLNYTNKGVMFSADGWELDYGPLPAPGGGRGWAANFYNDNYNTANGNGLVEAGDSDIVNPENSQFTVPVSHLWISATNIVNKGALAATASGDMVLNGASINLSRSILVITPISGQGSLNGTTNFSPDIAIDSLFWGTNYLGFMNSAALWNGAVARAPNFLVNGNEFDVYGNFNGACGASNIPVVLPAISSGVADYTNVVVGYTNIITTNQMGTANPPVLVPTNVIRQAIFVAISDPNISGRTSYLYTGNPTNLYRTASVQLLMNATDPVLGEALNNTVYIVDTLGSETNRGLNISLNVNPAHYVCSDSVYRPASYNVSRTDPGEFGAGIGGEGVPPPDFFYSTNFPGDDNGDPAFFTNNTVQNPFYAAYAASVDNLASDQVPIGTSLTNEPGRIRIEANTLNLDQAGFRSESQIMIHATNLTGSPAAVDCQNLSYTLGSATGNLVVTNFAKSFVSRLNGTLACWSAVWTNGYNTVIPNYSYDTNNTPPATPMFITNTTEVDFHVLFVWASELSSTVPVTVDDLALHSTNMTLSDTMTVTNSLLLDGQSFTLQGGLTLSQALTDWNYTLAPILRYFTNNGTLNVPNEAHFGDDGLTNYAAFVNNGTINAASETINSDYFQTGGSQTADSGFFVTTTSGKIENGSITCGGGVEFNAGTLKLNNCTVNAGDELFFNVTNALLDSGGSSGNSITCENGFDLSVKPPTGDLLGTAISTAAFNRSEVDHTWAALDRGATVAGFSNNVALGKLIFSHQGTLSPPLFHFAGTGVSNALYVDYLDLSQIGTNYANELQIDPNITIYYAAANLGFTPPSNTNGIPQEPEEYLNGQFGGHLRWVSSFAGPNSSVDVIINGQTVAVNRALRYSKIIDSNTNGIPNYYDPNPFNNDLVLSGSVVQTNLPPAKTFAISWTAAPDTVYQVQYSVTMSSGNWQPLLNYTNSTPTTQSVTVWDTNTISGQRFYRVSHQ